MNFHVSLVSPEKEVFSGDVSEVVVPSTNGDMGIMANHAPIITSLRPGILTIKSANAPKSVYVRGGFAEVNSKGLSIIAERVVPVEELNAEALASEIALIEGEVTRAKNDAVKQNAATRLASLKQIQTKH